MHGQQQPGKRDPRSCYKVTETTTAVDELERRLRLVVTSVARLMLSARYTGAVPLRDRKTKHDSLKVIRFGIRSQWSSQSSGVTWSNFRTRNTIRAVARKTDCSRQSWRAGSPTSVALPLFGPENEILLQFCNILTTFFAQLVDWANPNLHQNAFHFTLNSRPYRAFLCFRPFSHLTCANRSIFAKFCAKKWCKKFRRSISAHPINWVRCDLHHRVPLLTLSIQLYESNSQNSQRNMRENHTYTLYEGPAPKRWPLAKNVQYKFWRTRPAL